MNASAIDSRVFRNLFGTAAAREIFSDESYVQRMIATEAALARAEAAAGVIPKESAEAISKGCDVSRIKSVSFIGFNCKVNVLMHE